MMVMQTVYLRASSVAAANVHDALRVLEQHGVFVRLADEAAAYVGALADEFGSAASPVICDVAPSSLRASVHETLAVIARAVGERGIKVIALLDCRFAGTAARGDLTAALMLSGVHDVIPAWLPADELATRLLKALVPQCDSPQGSVQQQGGAHSVDVSSVHVPDVGHEPAGDEGTGNGQARDGQAGNGVAGDGTAPGSTARGSSHPVTRGSASGTPNELTAPARRISATQRLQERVDALGAPPHRRPGSAPALARGSGEPHVSQQPRPVLNVDRRVLTGPNGSAQLTAKEALVMHLLVEASGVVLRQQLAQAIWTQGWEGTPKAIDMHVANLRKKLRDVTGGAWRITAIRGAGFVLESTRIGSESLGARFEQGASRSLAERRSGASRQ